MDRIGNWNLSFLWFGAAISIAEILTGALIAPLGFVKGSIAIILGHIIGGIIFYLTGIIGAQTKLSALGTTRISFGNHGSILFSLINIMQLLGWTAVMIISSAKAINYLTDALLSTHNTQIACFFIGCLIFIWIGLGIKDATKVNGICVACLFAATIILMIAIVKAPVLETSFAGSNLTFGKAVELSIIMPLSWLPLISDYTRISADSKKGPLLAALAYFAGSVWMYVVGMMAAIYTGSADVAQILLFAGLGYIALLIVVFSTVTTVYLDVFSAGVSFSNIFSKANQKYFALFICALGTIIAAIIPIEEYENFLYLLGSVFAPLFAIILCDYYILGRKKIDNNSSNKWVSLLIWFCGFIIYRILLNYDFILGVSFPVILIVSITFLLVNKASTLRGREL